MLNIEVEHSDITKARVDAIVNCTTSKLVIGGGSLDVAIHRAAGPDLLDECKRIIEEKKCIFIGECVVTDSYKLPCKKVIHTTGPMYMGGSWGEQKNLAACYSNAIVSADKAGCESIAFPSLCTGTHSYPKKEAAELAVKTVRESASLCKTLSRVLFVCFDDETYSIYKSILN
ncbi:MAG: O-acetyl-ADP-ribose deacetylase [Termitinemataceae bacterium]|jgi:O-acetyl-ADP-ribose deacetylase (regulator of RNase III)|nr:MAG: O-acetyl-ADP-ribose deacetylase [Termitinemataceae bacterium]